MKPISVQNEDGETIEIKQDADGVIKIRHSDIDPKSFGVLRELGYPIDATDHHGWCFGLFAPPTSTLYGTGDTCTACCAKR